MATRQDVLKAGLELMIWAIFVCGQAVTAPAVNWLAVRGAIVWIKENQ